VKRRWLQESMLWGIVIVWLLVLVIVYSARR
jgi:hypothetical protein